MIEFLNEGLKHFEQARKKLGPPDVHSLNIIEHAAAQTVDHMNWRHGSVYLTGYAGKAASYASRGSEAIDLAKQLYGLASADVLPRLAECLRNYPELSEAMIAPNEACVIEIGEVRTESLRAERGGSPDTHLSLMLEHPDLRDIGFELVDPLPFGVLKVHRVIEVSDHGLHYVLEPLDEV